MSGPTARRLITLAIASATIAVGGATAGIAADFDIDALWDTYEQAVVSGDAEGWLALWDEGGVQMPPGEPARSYETLETETPKEWAEGSGLSAMNIEPIDFEVAGDWAFSRGEYNFTTTSEGGDVTIEGKFLTVFKRQEDGSFKIYRDCFNMNAQ